MGGGGQDVVKFFVSNLPERCNSSEIKDVFSAFGEVLGVYVARKRDKVGNRFGFISFSGARNLKDLVDNMKNVKMGSNKLKVNVARFAAENVNIPWSKGIDAGVFGVDSGKSSVREQFHGNRNLIHNPLGMSYRDSLLGKPRMDESVEKEVAISEFVKPFESWVNKSLIVRTPDLPTLIKLDKLLATSGGPKGELKYVGGLFMLIVFEDGEDMLAFKDHCPGAKEWFSRLEVWNGQALPFERIAWLKISGVPLHLLSNEVFDSVGRMFGKVVHASFVSSTSNDLSVDLVGVLVGEGVGSGLCSRRWRLGGEVFPG
ncbi:putative RNA recognition motif domain, nucleotide-binding alpha-beta plait domain superfamily [Helianthus debilis subsp. tardiflorus]